MVVVDSHLAKPVEYLKMLAMVVMAAEELELVKVLVLVVAVFEAIVGTFLQKCLLEDLESIARCRFEYHFLQTAGLSYLELSSNQSLLQLHLHLLRKVRQGFARDWQEVAVDSDSTDESSC